MTTLPVGDKIKINHIIHMSNISKYWWNKKYASYDCVANTSFIYSFIQQNCHNFFFLMQAEKYTISWHCNEEIWELFTFKALIAKIYYNISCFTASLIFYSDNSIAFWHVECGSYRISASNKYNSLVIMPMKNQKEKK